MNAPAAIRLFGLTVLDYDFAAALRPVGACEQFMPRCAKHNRIALVASFDTPKGQRVLSATWCLN